MPDSVGEKTEAPTPRRRSETRQQGRIAKSADLNAAIGLLGGLLCLRWLGPALMTTLMQATVSNLDPRDPAAAATVDVQSDLAQCGLAVLSAVGPLMLCLVLLSLIANFFQVGFLLTGYPLRPTLDKLSPFRGVTRLFSMRTVMQLAMNLVKLAIVSFIGYRAIASRSDRIMLAMDTAGWHSVKLITTVVYDVGIQLALALFILAILDYAWQRYKHERDLRMTKQEVKEEMRRMEGDPVIKQRRRRMQMARVLQMIRQAVPKADVVVTNPTELAIAVQYNAESMQAPRVVAKGQGYLALIIRELAMRHGVPIVERKPLAQALFKTVEVGQEVPEKFYQAIAEILAYVYKLSGKGPKRSAA